MKPLLVLVSGLLAATLVPSAAQAAGATTIGLDLHRGPAVSVPHVEGTDVVDGALRIPVDADSLIFDGTSGSSYVVTAFPADAPHGRVVRVAPDGSTTRLARDHGSATVVSDDGARVVTARLRRDRTTTVTVRSAVTGAPLASRRLRGYVDAFDVDSHRVLLGSVRRTLVWDTDADAVSVLTRHGAYNGDLGVDLVATYQGRMSDSGCTVLLRVSTGQPVSTLCDQQVAAFSPDGTRVATISSYADGPTGRVEARTLAGDLIGRYRSDRTTYVGEIRFETPTALLLEVIGGRRSGWARCTDASCELAGHAFRNR